jgi:hypothetical protein
MIALFNAMTFPMLYNPLNLLRSKHEMASLFNECGFAYSRTMRNLSSLLDGSIIIASASPYVEVASGEYWRQEFNIYDVII